MLLNVASLDHDPTAVAAYENSLVKLHGLSAQESAVIHSAGQSLHTVLAQNRQSASAIIAGRTALEASDVAALKELDRQREMTIVNLANQILNSVSAEVAARLRGAGHLLADTLHQN
jgi:predicted alpha/beta hydrolase